MHFPAPLVAAALLLSPAMARADALLDGLLAQSARAPVTAFERTTRKLLPEGDGPSLLVDRFTPTSASAGKWALVSVDGRKPTPREASAHLDSDLVAVVPGFHRLHQVLGAPPSARTEDQGRIVYRWTSLPKGAVVTPGGDISASLSAEAIVEQANGRPLISQVRIFAPRAFKIRGIATMNSFDVSSQYRPGAGGTPVLVSQTSMSDVKAPFGLGGKRHRQFSFRPFS